MQNQQGGRDIDTSAPEYREAWCRAREWPTCRLTSRARELAYRKALGHASHAEAVELRAIAAVYGERRTTVSCLRSDEAENTTMAALAGHLDRLATQIEATHSTTFGEPPLRRAAVRLVAALGYQLDGDARTFCRRRHTGYG